MCFCLFSPASCPAHPGSGVGGTRAQRVRGAFTGAFGTFRQGQGGGLVSLARVLFGSEFHVQRSCLLCVSVPLQPPSLEEKCPCLEPHSSAACLGCCRPKPRRLPRAQRSRARAGGKRQVSASCCRPEPPWKGLALLSGRGCPAHGRPRGRTTEGTRVSPWLSFSSSRASPTARVALEVAGV